MILGWTNSQENRREFVIYVEAAKSWDTPVAITYKQNDLPQDVGIVDFEKGRLDRLTDYAWLTDDTISAGAWTETGSWSYTEELDIKSSKELIHTLIDIVSKNGNLLLNISPRANGLIPNQQRNSLMGMGEWLKINGEHIWNSSLKNMEKALSEWFEWSFYSNGWRVQRKIFVLQQKIIAYSSFKWDGWGATSHS